VAETIVVGVDGSDGAAAALEFAATEAAFRGARLRIVSVWEVPVAAYGGGFAPPVADPALWDVFLEGAQHVADDALASVKKLQPSLDAEVLVVKGQPADVLLEQSDATLIVVGRRGLGGFKSLLLGSVSQQVVQHATCPVVVVNHPASDS
jgi:nucleotide-binding universal stress UspA family protein